MRRLGRRDCESVCGGVYCLKLMFDLLLRLGVSCAVPSLAVTGLCRILRVLHVLNVHVVHVTKWTYTCEH